MTAKHAKTADAFVPLDPFAVFVARRRSGRGRAALCFLVGCAAVAGESLAADWPGLRGPLGSGVSPERGLARRWADGEPRALWSRPLSAGFGGAAVRDREVYVLDRSPRTGDVLLCLDLNTGEERWRHAHGGPGFVGFDGTRATPAVDAEYVYTISPAGYFTCISRTTHERVWELSARAEFPRKALPQWGYGQSMVLHGDLAIVSVPDVTQPGWTNGFVLALDRFTGQRRWRSPNLGVTRFTFSSPLLARLGGVDQAVVMAHDTLGRNPPVTVFGLDPANGQVLWRTRTSAPYNIPIPQPVRVGDDALFIAGGYRVGCFGLRVRSTNGVWSASYAFGHHPNCTPHIQSPILYRGFLYAQSFDAYHNRTNNGLVCVTTNGLLAWKSGPDELFDNGPLLIADDLIFVLHGAKGELTLVEATPEAYRPVARAKVLPVGDDANPRLWGQMALSAGKLLVRGPNELKCLDVASPPRELPRDGPRIVDRSSP